MHNLVPWILIGAMFCGATLFTLQLVGLAIMIWGGDYVRWRVDSIHHCDRVFVDGFHQRLNSTNC